MRNSDKFFKMFLYYIVHSGMLLHIMQLNKQIPTQVI